MKPGTRLVLVMVFVLALGAGVVAGLVAAHFPAVMRHPVDPVGIESPLAEELGLTPEQREQMRKIWTGVRDLSNDSLRTANKLQDERDAAIAALISPDKREQYNEVKRKYDEGVAGMKGKRQAAFDKAVRETNGLLTESQREKYKRILKKRLGNDAGPAHDPRADQRV